MKRTERNRPRTLACPHLEGIELNMPCYLCEFGPPGLPTPCWGGETSGYTTCRKCWDSTGPEMRDCAIVRIPQYAARIDARGFAPYFALRGDLRVTGRVYHEKTRRPWRNLRVALVFPNGLTVSAPTDDQGRFTIRVESFERRKPVTLNIGAYPYRETGNRCFYLGFKLAPTLKRLKFTGSEPRAKR